MVGSKVPSVPLITGLVPHAIVFWIVPSTEAIRKTQDKGPPDGLATVPVMTTGAVIGLPLFGAGKSTCGAVGELHVQSITVKVFVARPTFPAASLAVAVTV